MIILNGNKFAENENEMSDSLFDGKHTCVGHAKRTKRTIVLTNLQKERIGIINKHGVLCCATKIDEGYWYTHGDIKEVGHYARYSQQYAEVNALSVNYDGDNIYK